MKRAMLLMCACVAIASSAIAEEGLVAAWEMQAKTGASVHDSSGNGIDAHIHGAEWIRRSAMYALQFESPEAYADCTVSGAFNLTGPVTVEAWVYPTALPGSETGVVGKSFETFGITLYGDQRFYWYVGGGANKCSAPADLRYWNHLAGTFDGKDLKLYRYGALADSHPSMFGEIKPGGTFCLGRFIEPKRTDGFRGTIGCVRVYRRALAPEEITAHYEAEKASYRRMEPGLDRVTMRPFFYFDEGVAYVDIDFGNLAPLETDDHAELTLWKRGGQDAVARWPVTNVPEKGLLRDFKAELGKLPPGEYELRATLTQGSRVRSQDMSVFKLPLIESLPSPNEHTVQSLADRPVKIPFDFVPCGGGGFKIRVGNDTYAVESTYSFPHGGQNALTVEGAADTHGESVWHVGLSKTEPRACSVEAGGAFYKIAREIAIEEKRVLVKDTFTNTGNERLGIMLSNAIRPPDGRGVAPVVYSNPTVFYPATGVGIGMVALDDVYTEQYENFGDRETAGLRSDKFALEPNASYTLEWAVYINGTGDYYDFINAARKDEGLIRTVEGNFAFLDRREPPTEEFVRSRGLKYASVPCLSHVADDPGISVEGVEFVEYPKECALLKAMFAETRKRFPELKVMFHVAHSLYPINKPDALFPDSRTIDSSGRQTDYGANDDSYYSKYFSKEHVDEGYRWYIFYPSKDNTFGPYMLKAIDYMLDEIGVNGMFADGFTMGYGGRFTYDRGDGHSAVIDPATKTVVKPIGSVNLLGQDIFVETIRKVGAKGGVVIANSYPGTRTVHKEPVIYCLESNSGGKTCALLYLAPTVIALGNPGPIRTERDVYDDIRDKLAWGGLYFYYGEANPTHPTLTEQMYPITVEEIHAGTIKGTERIVTMRSGVYGWAGDRGLHIAYRYDGRGMRVSHAFLTTTDAADTRTQVMLDKDETAVVRRLPIVVSNETPLNALVQRYDSRGVEFLLNGEGDVSVEIASGEFLVGPDASYVLTTDEGERKLDVKEGKLKFTSGVHGKARIAIEKKPGV